MADTVKTPQSALELAVVVPTFKERGNVVPVLEALDRCLQGIAHEVIFVDGRLPDGTGVLVREIARTNPHLGVLQRVGCRSRLPPAWKG